MTETERYLAQNLKEKEQEIGFIAGRGTSPTGRCSPGNHTHDGKKCHSIEIQHRGMPWKKPSIRKRLQRLKQP